MRTLLISATILFILSCNVQKAKFQPIVDKIKKELMKEIPEVNGIDTIYLYVRNISPRDKMVLQSAEYMWASTEAKREGNPMSVSLEKKSDEFFSMPEFSDSTTFLCYEAMTIEVYTKKDSEKGLSQKSFLFNKEMDIIPRYSFIEKVAKGDNNAIMTKPYEPFTPEEYENIKNFIRYY
jgi:hypothetical protein